MAAEQRHVLKATDNCIKAFVVSEGILETERIGRFKEVAGKSLPFLVVAATDAERLRAKSWKVTGTLELLTSPTANPGESESALDYSDELERDLLNAFEQYVPTSDTPQELAAAIQSAGIAADVAESNHVLVNAFYINKVEAGINDGGNWTFIIDFTANVIA